MKGRNSLRLPMLLALPVIVGVSVWLVMARMPGASYRGPLDPLDAGQTALRDTLRSDVNKLAGEIGERNMRHPTALAAAAAYIEQELERVGYTPRRQTFEVRGEHVHNIEAEIVGGTRKNEIVVIGAHYDTAIGTPGANDNGSGVAAMLAIARASARMRPERTLRFVAFVNEEPPWSMTDDMGSFVYARRCKQRREKVVAMLSLETLGYYSDRDRSQQYPFPLDVVYPATGDFIGFVGNLSSRKLVRKAVGSFRAHIQFPSEGGALPSILPGVGWSDHWSFWEHGYPAIMVTDTAFYRYAHYHSEHDTPNQLVYDRLARVVDGLIQVMKDLVNEGD